MKTLADLGNVLPIPSGKFAAAAEPREIEATNGVAIRLAMQVNAVSIDSRLVKTGTLFVALNGEKTDGHRYWRQALAQGATAVVLENLPPELIEADQTDLLSRGVIIVPSTAAVLTPLCREIYGTATITRNLHGITGTDGKTTTTAMITWLLNKVDYPAGSIGTLGAKLPDGRNLPTAYTTPPAPELHRLLAQLQTNGARAVCMEVSSQAAVQHRVDALAWQTMTFTNFTVDHLDYHHTVENYALAKASLFRGLSKAATAVLNADDPLAYYLAQLTQAQKVFYYIQDDALGSRGDFSQYIKDRGKILGKAWEKFMLEVQEKIPPESSREILCKAAAAGRVVAARNVKPTNSGWQAEISRGEETCTLTIPLLGRFNLNNALAAIATAMVICPNIDLRTWAAVMATMPAVPGRLEIIDGQGQACPTRRPSNGKLNLEDTTTPYRVVIDFAHTPGAMEALLTEVRRHCCANKKLWVLANSCGNRDRGKRPLIAAVCERLADRIVLTLEEVGQENPAEILAELQAGFQQPENIPVVPLRQEAIRYVISRLEPGDYFVVPSLGDEHTYNINNVAYPYVERDFVKQCLAERAMVDALIELSSKSAFKSDGDNMGVGEPTCNTKIPCLPAYFARIYYSRWRDSNQSTMN